MKRGTLVCVALGGGLVCGCVSARPSPLSAGNAKRFIKVGVTTQAEVVEAFGSPNIVTMKYEGEVWVYDKVSSRHTAGTFGIGGLGGGVGSGGAGGGLIGGGVGSSTRSETTVMLIVYFDHHDVVQDYKLSQTQF